MIRPTGGSENSKVSKQRWWQWQQDSEFLEQLDQRLRQMVHRRLTSGVDEPSASSVVQESWLRLLRSDNLQGPVNRAYLYAAAAKSIGRVLADHARQRNAQRRAHSRELVALDRLVDALSDQHFSALDLNNALTDLRKTDGEGAAIVELKFYGDLSFREIAELTGQSSTTVFSKWEQAKGWLYRRLNEEDAVLPADETL